MRRPSPSPFLLPAELAIAYPRRTLLNSLVRLLEQRGVPYEVLFYETDLPSNGSTEIQLANRLFPIRKGQFLITGMRLGPLTTPVELHPVSASVANRQITRGRMDQTILRALLTRTGTEPDEIEYPTPIRIRGGDTLAFEYRYTLGAPAIQPRALQIEGLHIPADVGLFDVPTLEMFQLGETLIPVSGTSRTQYSFDGDGVLFAQKPAGLNMPGAQLRLDDEPLWAQPSIAALPGAPVDPGSHLFRRVKNGAKLYYEVTNNAGAPADNFLGFWFLRPWKG